MSTCLHKDITSHSCPDDSHSSLGDGIGCMEYACKDCGTSVHELCGHGGSSRTWQDCDTEGHPKECVVGCCDNCGADVSHDYGVPELEDTTNIDLFKKSVPEDTEGMADLPKSNENLSWKDSQQFRDIMHNNFYKKDE